MAKGKIFFGGGFVFGCFERAKSCELLGKSERMDTEAVYMSFLTSYVQSTINVCTKVPLLTPQSIPPSIFEKKERKEIFFLSSSATFTFFSRAHLHELY